MIDDGLADTAANAWKRGAAVLAGYAKEHAVLLTQYGDEESAR